MTGAYEKLLRLFDMDLSTPYNEREEVLNHLVKQLGKIEDDLGFWDEFLEADDMRNRLEDSCLFIDAMEGASSEGYESGYECGLEENNEDFIDRLGEWKDKLVYFLKDKWVNLNKEQIQEVEDYLLSYPIPE